MIKTWLKKNGLSNKGNIYDLVRKCKPHYFAMDLRQRHTDDAKVEYCEELPRRLGRCEKASVGRELWYFKALITSVKA